MIWWVNKVEKINMTHMIKPMSRDLFEARKMNVVEAAHKRIGEIIITGQDKAIFSLDAQNHST